MNGYFKNTGWKYEILRFIKKKRLLCFMMIISIFIVMKYSSLPFIFGLDSISFIRVVFQTPDTNTGKEVLRIAENLSLAYCTSLLFYIMVDYVPMRQTELKTRKLMDSHLNELNQHMTQLYAMTLYCLNCEKGIYELPKTELNAYGPLAITNEEKYCNMELKKLGTGEWIMGENPAPFNDYQRLKGKSNAIINQITNMLSLPYAEKLEEELIDLLNMIKEDDYIGQLSRLSEKFFPPGYQFIMNNFNIYFSNFATKWWRLQMINVTPLICTYEDATEESVNECKARYEALKEQYPESFAFMEAFNSHNQ